MTCPFCGKADNPAYAKFCSHCGTALLPSQPAQPVHLNQPAQPDEPAHAPQVSAASHSASLPGRSRHGFYAGQVSHLDQVVPVHGAIHAQSPIHSERTDEVPEGADAASPSSHAALSHFDARYGTGGRFVSRRPDPLAPAEMPPPPAPEPDRSPAITPEMFFWFGPKQSVPVAVPPSEESRPVPPMVGAPDPDPVSRSFGTWAIPPAPTSRPDFVVAAQQAQSGRDVDAAAYATAQLDLTTVRDLFPEPRWDGESPPGTPAEPAPRVAPDDRPVQAVEEGQQGVDPGSVPREPAPEVASPVAVTAATGPQDAVSGMGAEPIERPRGERDRLDHDLGWAASRTDQTGTGGPAGPIGPVDVSADRSGEPTDVTPPTKQSRYWATGAHASAFVGAWMGGVPAFVGPLVVWLARKDNDPFAAEHGRNALNFNLSVIVYVLGLIIVSIITFGIGLLVTIPGFIVLGLAWFAFTLVGTIKAASSETYKYPLTIKFVR